MDHRFKNRTLEICRTFDCVTAVSLSNSGSSHARNKEIKIAQGLEKTDSLMRETE